MILDTQLKFSGSIANDSAATRSGQALTATAVSANIIDLRQAASPALADEAILGGDLWLVVTAKTAAAGGDAAKTLTITLESDSTTNLATSPTVHYSSGAILGSAIIAGAVLVRIKLPSGDYERYLGLRYTVSAGFTSFEVVATLTPDVNRNIIYPSGFTIDA